MAQSDVELMRCSSCGERTEHKKKKMRGKTVWKCQECYSIHVG